MQSPTHHDPVGGKDITSHITRLQFLNSRSMSILAKGHWISPQTFRSKYYTLFLLLLSSLLLLLFCVCMCLHKHASTGHVKVRGKCSASSLSFYFIYLWLFLPYGGLLASWPISLWAILLPPPPTAVHHHIQLFMWVLDIEFSLPGLYGLYTLEASLAFQPSHLHHYFDTGFGMCSRRTVLIVSHSISMTR